MLALTEASGPGKLLLKHRVIEQGVGKAVEHSIEVIAKQARVEVGGHGGWTRTLGTPPTAQKMKWFLFPESRNDNTTTRQQSPSLT
jgi:hypothetical protein